MEPDKPAGCLTPAPKPTAGKPDRSLEVLDSVIAAEAHGRRKAFEEAAEAVQSACKECDKPVKTHIIGWVDKGDQRLPVHQLDENLLECPGCAPALRAIRALAKEGE